jgi:hypothetical protein
MRKVNLNQIAEDERKSPKGKFHKFVKDISIALGREKESLDLIEQMAGWKEQFIALFADFASRYVVRAECLMEKEHEYFTRALVLSHDVMPHSTAAFPQSQFNPLFWICDKENDLPSWLTLENPRIRSIVVPKPDHILRRALVQVLTPGLEGHAEAAEKEIHDCHDAFVEQTEGMVMTDVISITQLCRREKLPFQEIAEAVRRYKLGVTEDPWKRLHREKVANGAERFETAITQECLAAAAWSLPPPDSLDFGTRSGASRRVTTRSVLGC